MPFASALREAAAIKEKQNLRLLINDVSEKNKLMHSEISKALGKTSERHSSHRHLQAVKKLLEIQQIHMQENKHLLGGVL